MRAIIPLVVILIVGAILVISLKNVKVEGSGTTPTQTLTMNDSNPTSTPQGTPTPVASPAGKPITTSSGLIIQDEVVGTGVEATAGKAVTVNYVGTLTDGTKFDSSYDRNQPFTFHLGAGEVIKGWDEGVQGMKIGGKRKLTIPASIGYGPAGAPPVIPGNATLVFEVELLEVK